MTTTAAWANPYSLHPWFRMPSHKRKTHSDEEDDAPSTFHEPRRSLSPTPSPKRRRCDVLENGMSQLTLDGLQIPPPANPASASYPTVLFPDTPAASSHPPPLWANASYALGPNVTPIPTNAAATVVLPGSVEEPTSSETASEDAEVQDVSMKTPSWYEIEKDRTSASSASSASSSTITIPTFKSLGSRRTPSPPRTTRKPLFRHPPRPTVVDVPDRDTGIVITDLEDSDAEDESTALTKPSSADAPAFTISSALLDRLPKPHALGPLAPEPSPSNALVLYRPLAVVPDESQDADASPGEEEGLGAAAGAPGEPMGEIEEVPMEDTRPCTPMALEPVPAVDEPVDEPMDIEML